MLRDCRRMCQLSPRSNSQQISCEIMNAEQILCDDHEDDVQI